MIQLMIPLQLRGIMPSQTFRVLQIGPEKRVRVNAVMSQQV